MAGFRGEAAPQIFWSTKTIGLVVGFALGGGTVLAIRGEDIDTLTYAGVIAGLMFYAPEIGRPGSSNAGVRTTSSTGFPMPST